MPEANPGHCGQSSRVPALCCPALHYVPAMARRRRCFSPTLNPTDITTSSALISTCLLASGTSLYRSMPVHPKHCGAVWSALRRYLSKPRRSNGRTRVDSDSPNPQSKVLEVPRLLMWLTRRPNSAGCSTTNLKPASRILVTVIATCELPLTPSS